MSRRSESNKSKKSNFPAPPAAAPSEPIILSRRGGPRPGAGRRPSSAPTNVAYEGAWRFNPNRAWIWTGGLDAKKELQSGNRQELNRKANWLVNNIGLAGGALDKISRYVGPLRPQARTMDEDWNREAEQAFHDAAGWAPGVDASAFVNFFQAPALLVKQMAVSGDVFWQRSLSANGRGLFRIIPGEHVGSAGGSDEEGWQDGVRVNPLGRPVSYRVLTRPGSQDYVDLSSDDITQVRRAYRVGYTRAPSWFARACNHLQDYSEYLGYEKTSAKLGAQLGVIITTPAAGIVGLGAAPLVQGQSGTSPQPVTVDNMINSTVIPQLKPGETIESFRNEHPASNFDPFIRVLARDIAVGFGTSPEFLFDMTEAGGASTRWVLEEASVMIRDIQDIIVHSFARPFWKYWIWNEIEAGRLRMPGDGRDWWRVEFTPPADLSVDFGRDGRLMSDLLLRGQISPQRYYGLQGLSADHQDDDVIRFACRRKKRVEEIAKEEGVEITLTEIFPPAPGSPIPAEATKGDPQGE